MTKANEYVLKNWNKYGDFESKEECKHFLIACEAYDTSYEIAHEDPITAYETFGFAWLGGYGEELTTRDVIKAITDYSQIFENTTREDVARIFANIRLEDGDIEPEDLESEIADLLAGDCDNDIMQVGNDVLYRIYC